MLLGSWARWAGCTQNPLEELLLVVELDLGEGTHAAWATQLRGLLSGGRFPVVARDLTLPSSYYAHAWLPNGTAGYVTRNMLNLQSLRVLAVGHLYSWNAILE